MTIGRRAVLFAVSNAALASAYPGTAAADTGRRRQDLSDTQAIIAIEQLMNEWVHQIDSDYGRSIVEADILTLDCRCKLEDQWIFGRDAIADFYKQRFETVKAGEPVPVIRQLLSNFRIALVAEAEADVGFNLQLFMKAGRVPFSDYCDPVEVADVRARARRGSDGYWRISYTDSDRISRRER